MLSDRVHSISADESISIFAKDFPEGRIKLTLKEAELLALFLKHRNKVLKREDVLVKLWGENDYFLGCSLDVFISRLRKYMKAEKSVKLETIRGVGYLLKI